MLIPEPTWTLLNEKEVVQSSASGSESDDKSNQNTAKKSAQERYYGFVEDVQPLQVGVSDESFAKEVSGGIFEALPKSVSLVVRIDCLQAAHVRSVFKEKRDDFVWLDHKTLTPEQIKAREAVLGSLLADDKMGWTTLYATPNAEYYESLWTVMRPPAWIGLIVTRSKQSVSWLDQGLETALAQDQPGAAFWTDSADGADAVALQSVEWRTLSKEEAALLSEIVSLNHVPDINSGPDPWPGGDPSPTPLPYYPMDRLRRYLDRKLITLAPDDCYSNMYGGKKLERFQFSAETGWMHEAGYTAPVGGSLWVGQDGRDYRLFLTYSDKQDASEIAFVPDDLVQRAIFTPIVFQQPPPMQQEDDEDVKPLPEKRVRLMTEQEKKERDYRNSLTEQHCKRYRLLYNVPSMIHTGYTPFDVVEGPKYIFL
ncbi:MAG: hypothetical protein RIB45_01210 [Marivibrio sp.]|uniref:hypothetical protein n=1 Tax=Marivibrio sp. TaxID=2039719 RepID=UPI0032EF0348